MGNCKKGAGCKFGHYFSEAEDVGRHLIWNVPKALEQEPTPEWRIMAIQFICTVHSLTQTTTDS